MEILQETSQIYKSCGIEKKKKREDKTYSQNADWIEVHLKKPKTSPSNKDKSYEFLISFSTSLVPEGKENELLCQGEKQIRPYQTRRDISSPNVKIHEFRPSGPSTPSV